MAINMCFLFDNHRLGNPQSKGMENLGQGHHADVLYPEPSGSYSTTTLLYISKAGRLGTAVPEPNIIGLLDYLGMKAKSESAGGCGGKHYFRCI